jgi:nucleoside-diphosphate-sugar epimerase
MDVLLAGCGWLGREVAKNLLGRGDRVTALTRTVESATRLRESGIEAIALDLASPAASRSIPGRYDGIIALQSASSSGPAAYRRAYLEATRAILESEGAAGAAFVYVSSTGVFGQSGGEWVDETTEPAPSEPTAAVLLEAERLVLDRSRHRVDPRIVRCSGLYGPGRTGTIERVRTGALALGDGDETWMNFCHRDDAAVTVIAALDRGTPGGSYHASDAHPAMRRDVICWIASRLGIDPSRTPAGSPPGGRRGANRRVRSEATRRELRTVLAYPSFREGFGGLFG